MKSKTFVEPRWLAAIIFGVVFFGPGIFMSLISALVMVMHYNESVFAIPLCLLGIAMGLGAVLLYILFLLPKTFSLLTVSFDTIVWRCPFYRSVKINAEDCKYVGVVDMAAHNRVMPVIRGDEIAYIYLSNMPFPEKYKHKADMVRRKKGLITFAYSDTLCQKLIDIFPEEKTKSLISFYNRMQTADKIKKQQALKRKAKKK